ADAVQIFSRVTVFPKDRWSSIAALDRPIEIVPFVDPTQRNTGQLLFVEASNRFAESDLPKQLKRSVQNTVIVPSRDQDVLRSADASALQPITIGSQICRDAKLWGKMAELVHGANDDAAFACNPRLDAKRRAEHAANAANEFLTCRLLERVVSQNGDAG